MFKKLWVMGLMVSVAILSSSVLSAYLGSEPVCVTGVAFNDVLNVRSHARANSSTLGALAPNACGLNVESVEGSWTYIRGTDNRGRNIQGWVNNNFLRAATPGILPGTSPASGFPTPAASGGGVVRSGPGVHYRKLASTREFEPITIVRNTGTMMNGYPWFEIRFKGQRRGYQWGGIICSTTRSFTGTFDSCENYRGSLQGNNVPAQSGGVSNAGQTQQRQVAYSCNEGIPLNVTFVDTPNESYALYSHDSGPTNRVASAVSGSGFRYSNGYHELRGKGRTIDLIEGGQVLDSCMSN